MRVTDQSDDQSKLAFAGIRRKRKAKDIYVPSVEESAESEEKEPDRRDTGSGAEQREWAPGQIQQEPEQQEFKENTKKAKRGLGKPSSGKKTDKALSDLKKQESRKKDEKGQPETDGQPSNGRSQKVQTETGRKSSKERMKKVSSESVKRHTKKSHAASGDSKRKVVIEVKNLYKIYKVGSTKVRALNGVDFKVYEGEFCAIVGTSGSGKSTLLNMLAGLEKPTKGEVIIAGHHIEKMNENKLVRFRQSNVGFIFQSFNLLGTMNAIENVALPLSFRGMAKDERLKKAKKMLKLVGLEKHALHRPNQMSGGQQQRVGMARALVVNPKIMFADEPTGNLDSKTSKEMMNLMRRIVNEQKKTLVMVTHDDSLAAIADKVIRIVDGRIVNIEDRSTKIVEDTKHEQVE